MSSAEQPAKRRRVDTANLTLRKPFKSPLIKRPQAGADRTADSPDSPAVRRAISTRPRGKFVKHAGAPAVKPVGAETRTASTVEASGTGAELRDLVTRRKQDLNQQIREAGRQLELVQQAQRIESASLRRRPGEEIDIDLKELIQKWTGASRQAAEELFELIKERVDGMGGAKAWRDAQQRQAEGFTAFDQQLEADQTNGVQGAEGANNVSTPVEDDRTCDGNSEEASDQDETSSKFTLSMMLKSLNIEPDTLGFMPADLDEPG